MKKVPAPEGARHQTRNQYSVTASCAERLDAIRIALLEHGIEPANPDDFLSQLVNHEGHFIRTGTASKPHSKNAWGVAYHDRGLPVVVIAGDWSTGAEMKWVAWDANSITPAERLELQRSMAEAKQAREKEQALQWEAIAVAAVRRWHSSHSADPQHPYLQSKGIQPHRARQQGRELVLLLSDFSGKGWSLQTIDEAGKKLLMAGGKKAGHFIVVGGPDYPARVLICEGWATGCTLAEIDPAALVLAAVDCGNLQAVATGARNRWPDADLIVCGDDDRATPGNPGATAARSAALAAGARLALPEWPPEAPKHLSDFNDLHQWLRGHL